MRIQYRVLAIACFAIAAKADVQKVARSFDAKRGEIIAELKAEAARLERGSISDVFADLGNPGEIGRLRLSAEQADLARRLDQAALAVVRAWLLRGLDSGTPPLTAELAERLGEPGGRLRNAVAAHSEAVAREAVLTRHQNRKTRTASGSAAGVLPRRYGLLPSLNDKPPQTAVDFNSMIRGMAAGLKNPKIPASEIFGILTAGARDRPDCQRSNSSLSARSTSSQEQSAGGGSFAVSAIRRQREKTRRLRTWSTACPTGGNNCTPAW